MYTGDQRLTSRRALVTRRLLAEYPPATILRPTSRLKGVVGRTWVGSRLFHRPTPAEVSLGLWGTRRLEIGVKPGELGALTVTRVKAEYILVSAQKSSSKRENGEGWQPRSAVELMV